MKNYKHFILLIALILVVKLSATAQVKPDKTYTSRGSIDSVLKNTANILELKKGDPDPLVTEDGQMHYFSKLKDFDADNLGRVQIYHSLKGTGYESYRTGENQKLIYLSSKSSLSESNEERSGFFALSIPGDDSKSGSVNDQNKIYEASGTQTAPQYPGGEIKFKEYVKANLKYPKLAAEREVQGKVYVKFVVEPNGTLTNIRVFRELGSGTDEEAVRLLSSGKKWIPGMISGKPVRTNLVRIIEFKL